MKRATAIARLDAVLHGLTANDDTDEDGSPEADDDLEVVSEPAPSEPPPSAPEEEDAPLSDVERAIAVKELEEVRLVLRRQRESLPVPLQALLLPGSAARQAYVARYGRSGDVVWLRAAVERIDSLLHALTDKEDEEPVERSEPLSPPAVEPLPSFSQLDESLSPEERSTASWELGNVQRSFRPTGTPSVVRLEDVLEPDSAAWKAYVAMYGAPDAALPRAEVIERISVLADALW